MIEGIKITPLKQIEDERGKVMHMLRNDSKNFTKFGEIYFSFTNPNSIKASARSPFLLVSNEYTKFSIFLLNILEITLLTFPSIAMRGLL